MSNIKGVFIGEYNEQDLREGKDKKDVERVMSMTGFNNIDTEFVESQGKIVAIRLYANNRF